MSKPCVIPSSILSRLPFDPEALYTSLQAHFSKRLLFVLTLEGTRDFIVYFMDESETQVEFDSLRLHPDGTHYVEGSAIPEYKIQEFIPVMQDTKRQALFQFHVKRFQDRIIEVRYSKKRGFAAYSTMKPDAGVNDQYTLAKLMSIHFAIHAKSMDVYILGKVTSDAVTLPNPPTKPVQVLALQTCHIPY